MIPENRNRLSHQIKRALAKPGLVLPYLRRRLRNRRIRATATSHPEFYRAVMASDVRTKTAYGAVGTADHDQWLQWGQMQFDYLVSHGLEPRHRLLEIGCGNLRAGWRLIQYLDRGNYVGVDISPEIIVAGERTVVDYELQDKRPALFVVDGTSLGFLPAADFDAVHAHSVFTHTPLEVVEAYFAEVARVLKPGGFFDFTYHASDEAVWTFLEEDYYFPPKLLLDLADSHGFDGRLMEDWTYKQPKIRLEKRQSGVATSDDSRSTASL